MRTFKWLVYNNHLREHFVQEQLTAMYWKAQNTGFVLCSYDHPCTCDFLHYEQECMLTNCMQYRLHYPLSFIVQKSIGNFCVMKSCIKIISHLTSCKNLACFKYSVTKYFKWLIFLPCMSVEAYRKWKFPSLQFVCLLTMRIQFNTSNLLLVSLC